MGFSDGGYAGYKLAALHPELVKRLIVIGASDRPKGSRIDQASYTPELLLGQSKDYFESRLALMPEPKRWGECLSWINKLYNEDFISIETFEKIKCPALVMGGDLDGGHSAEALVKASRLISNSSLAIIGGCSHVVFYCNFPAVWDNVDFFLKNGKI